MKKKSTVILIISIVSVILIAAVTFLLYYLTVKLPDIRLHEQRLEEYNALYAKMLADFEEENQQYQDYEVDIVFLGDSLTAGYDVSKYYLEYLVANRGIGGDTTHSLIKRLAVSVLDLKPKICVLLIGGNNPDSMFEDYENILICFKENLPDTEVVVLSHAPTSGEVWGSRNKTFAYNNVKIKLLAEKYGYVFVDIYSPMLDIETGEMNALYTVDGAHFTKQGYDVVTQTLKPVLDKLMEEN